MRYTGTVARGIRMPIIREGDDLATLVVDNLLAAAEAEKLIFSDRDIVCITEAVVARAEGNYATVDQIAAAIRQRYPGGHIGLVFPILSRNRFAMILKGVARGADKITLLLSYPSDEVGNALITPEKFDASAFNPYTDLLDEQAYRDAFGDNAHPFTGVDYVSFYRSLITAEHCDVEIILGNDSRRILAYAKDVLACDIHTREKTVRILKEAGGRSVFSLADILSQPVGGSGYNETFGLLGSNTADAERIKLFPRGAAAFVTTVAERLKAKTGRQIEVMVYGDGAFKDPAGKIWELADPVVSPAYTPGLEGMPHEVKLKFVADTLFAHLSGDRLTEAVTDYIRTKDSSVDRQDTLGTTPRKLTDLLGSLADLISGSGDKGTPVVLIQGYFDSLAN